MDSKSNTQKLNSKDFERIVHMIQQTYADHKITKTKTYRNKKLATESGRLREFDVYIESTLSGVEVNMAIECKKHKRKIEVEKVEAFHSKCLAFPCIHRKIMVSYAGYQEGALDRAKAFGIHLFQLLESNDQTDELRGIKPVSRQRHVREMKLEFLNEAPDVVKMPASLKQGNNVYDLLQFLKDNPPPTEFVRFIANTEPNPLYEHLTLVFPSGFFLIQEKDYELKCISMLLEVWSQPNDDSVHRLSWVDVTRGTKHADVFDAPLQDRGRITIVKPVNSNNVEITFQHKMFNGLDGSKLGSFNVRNDNGDIKIEPVS